MGERSDPRPRHWAALRPAAFAAVLAAATTSLAAGRTGPGPSGGDAPPAAVPGISSPGSAGPQTYGTDTNGYVTLDATEFSPLSSTYTYAMGITGFRRFLTNVQGLGFGAALHLPAGALVTFIELDGYDATPNGLVAASLGVCDFDGQNCVYQAGSCSTIATVCSTVEGAPGNFSTFAYIQGDGIIVDNFFKKYVVAAGNTTNDSTTSISQVIVGYLLRVSPAPPTATWNDVPTSHPFFQYVEALTASQITSGCGGNNYCPDAPLTRAQMAVFLSKALGLQWP